VGIFLARNGSSLELHYPMLFGHGAKRSRFHRDLSLVQ
jgi:hypothetical protein